MTASPPESHQHHCCVVRVSVVRQMGSTVNTFEDLLILSCAVVLTDFVVRTSDPRGSVSHVGIRRLREMIKMTTEGISVLCCNIVIEEPTLRAYILLYLLEFYPPHFRHFLPKRLSPPQNSKKQNQLSCLRYEAKSLKLLGKEEKRWLEESPVTQTLWSSVGDRRIGACHFCLR